MKTIFSFLLVVLFFTACQQNKIAFVDNQMIIKEYKEAVLVNEEYQSLLSAYGKNLDSVSKALEVEYIQFEAKKDTYTEVERNAEIQRLENKRSVYEQNFRLKEQQIKNEINVKMDSLSVKVKSFVSDYGKEKGYTFIFGKNENYTIYYADSKNDITSVIVKALNKEFEAN